MIKFTKKVFSVFLAVIFVLTGIVTTAQAATNWPATSKIQTYVITTKNNTKVYKTATSSDGSYGTIYATDLITINSYDSSSKRIYVTYPVSSGTKKGYIPLSAVTSGTWNKATGTFTATAKKTTYRRASTSSSLGYISKGDKCYKVATSGSYTQIIYPISGGYKMGWIKTSDIPDDDDDDDGSGTSGSSLPTAIFLKQQGSNTCTLTSAAMMLRARKYLSGKSYSSITEAAIKDTAWSSGLKWSWKYSGISVNHLSTSGISVKSLKSVLDKHPESIVLYCGGKPHAVFCFSYSGDTFYCADPLSGYSGKKLTLANSYLGKCYGSQANVLKKVTAYWYVSSY
ncbi:MAG: hypothetical protein LUC97_01835 [Clostridiales bacterium]|nr:hypothetical protein [Clostridiales bacterium]